MTWSADLVASLDRLAIVVATSHGDVQLAREGDGPSVMVIHGGPGGFDLGLAWARHLSAGGCEVLALSRPGYLRTPLSSGRSPEEQADLYAAMLDAVGIERTAVLGFSAGGPSAVHFAARHPERTDALFLDAAILAPHEVPFGAIRRSTFESGLVVWLTYQLVMRWPALMARFAIGGLAGGLDRAQQRAAARWMTSETERRRSLQEQFASIAPKRYRWDGWANDTTNERQLAPLPLGDVAAPTLIAHGTNDAIVPIEHATNAAKQIARAELILVDEGHHLLSLSRGYGPVAQRQLDLARN